MPERGRPSGPNRGPHRGPSRGPGGGPGGRPDRRGPPGPARRPARPDGPTSRIGPTKPPKREQPDLPDGAIIYQDDAIIVVDKPAGLPVRVPVRGRPEPDLIHAIAKKLDLSPRKPQLWPADEIDAEASGLVVLAKRPAAADALRTEFKRNRVHRVMLAATEGVPGGAESDQTDAFVTHQSMLSPGMGGTTQSEPGGFRGGVRASDLEDDGKGKTPAKGPHPSTSHVKVERATDSRAVVRIRLETAFPHQERAHLADMGTPIVGDRLYGFPPPDGSRPPAGLALQRAELGFTHPATQKKVRYKIPEPVLFARLLGEHREQSKADNTWEPVADWYQGLIGGGQSDHHENLILPGVLELLGNVANAKILDIACGQGVLARALASNGAEVTGVDASPTLIEAASKTAGSTETYTVGDVRDLRAALGDAGPFDGAACVLAAMNIDPFPPVLEGAASLLRPGSPLVIVVMHPAFRIPKATDWQWDEQDGRTVQFRRVAAYTGQRAEPIVMNPGAVASGADPVTTTTHHRPISFYVNALAGAGFAVDRLDEWSSKRESEPGPRADAENAARREIPMFLAIRARRA